MSFTERRRFLARPTIGTLPDIDAPSAPVDGVTVFSADIAGRSMLSTIDSGGVATPLQPFLGTRRVGQWRVNGTTSVAADGMALISATGTATSRGPTSTNLFTSLRRVGYVSAAPAASTAQLNTAVNQFWRGNAAGFGGFHAVMNFGISDAVIVDGPSFFGLAPSAVSAGQPSAFVNCFGVGNDTGDTNLQLYASGASAQARVSLGANFPVNTTNVDVYSVQIFALPNGSSIGYRVTRLNTGHVASGVVSTAANLIADTQFVSPKMYRSNDATAAAVAFDLIGVYVEAL